MIKQIIVVRTDLKMKPGKLAAQVAHTCMKVFFDMMEREMTCNGPLCHHRGSISNVYFTDPVPMYSFYPTKQMDEWMQSIFTKICLKAESEQQLEELAIEAEEVGLPVSRIIDSGLTVFNNVPTFTCIAIGPDNEEKIDEITGHLKLL